MIEELKPLQEKEQQLNEFLNQAIFQIIFTVYRDKTSATGWRYKSNFQFMSSNPNLPTMIGLPPELQFFSKTPSSLFRKSASVMKFLAGALGGKKGE